MKREQFAKVKSVFHKNFNAMQFVEMCLQLIAWQKALFPVSLAVLWAQQYEAALWVSDSLSFTLTR